jgi:hypothetical protein
MFSTLLVFVALIVSKFHVDAFALLNKSRQSFTDGRTSLTQRYIPATSDLKMAFDTDIALTLTSPLLASVSLVHPMSAFRGALQNPLVEAELFSDAAHIAMDLSSLFGPNNLIIQLLVIIGRLFGIASDYIPDHSINPEEFAFQSAMLALSCKDLLANVHTKWQASSHKHSLRDMRCYVTLFDEAGISWSQYKLMLAMASQWINVEPGSIIAEAESQSDCMYWLYSGEVAVESMDTHETVQYVACRSNHLLGSLPNTVLKVGVSGATLLCIDTSKLTDDDSLTSALQSLRFQSMQACVASMIEQRTGWLAL